MKNTEKVLVAFLSLLIILLIFVGVLKLLNEINVLDKLLMDSTDINSQIANPASSNCLVHGGKLEIRYVEDGGQVGYCVFKNGNECEEWAYYRGECFNIS
jgi:putative hemolysin